MRFLAAGRDLACVAIYKHIYRTVNGHLRIYMRGQISKLVPGPELAHQSAQFVRPHESQLRDEEVDNVLSLCYPLFRCIVTLRYGEDEMNCKYCGLALPDPTGKRQRE